jgi:6-phosphogluconolactonase (cycloisomerase 2 family)
MPPRFRRAALAVAALTALVPAAAHAAQERTLFALSGNVQRAMTSFQVAADGGLTNLGDFSTGTDQPRDVAVTPDGRFGYLGYSDSTSHGGVYVLTIAPGGEVGGFTRLPFGHTQRAVAVSPDGRFLYAGDEDEGVVRAFAIGGDGLLTAVGGAVAAGGDVVDLAVSPDGASVYTTSFWDQTVTRFNVQADGSVAAPVPTTVPGAFASPGELTITPGGDHLLVQDSAQAIVHAYPIGAGGALGAVQEIPSGGVASGPLAASPAGAFAFTSNNAGTLTTLATAATLTPVSSTAPLGATIAGSGVAVSADGTSLYVRDNSAHTIRRFAVDDAGALTEAGTATPVYTTLNDAGALVLRPNQPPVAGFTTELFGLTLVVDALDDSTDPDGQVARYDGDFGDGTTLQDGGPITAHDYTGFGTYTVTVTETDDQGCSTQRTYTGSTVACNGGPGARTTRTVTIAPPPIILPKPAAPTTVVTPDATAPTAPAAAPPALPVIDGRGAGPVRATRTGRVTLPELTAVCTAGAGPCDDNAVAVNATVRGQRVTLGTATFRLADGESAHISLRLSKPGRRLLARERSLDVQALVRVRNAATAAQAVRTVDLTLLAPRRR